MSYRKTLTILTSLPLHLINYKITENNFGVPKIQIICIPITLNNTLKVCLSNKKYTITTQSRPTQIVKVYFFIGKPGFNGFFKIIGVQI